MGKNTHFPRAFVQRWKEITLACAIHLLLLFYAGLFIACASASRAAILRT
jgi:hypothetical protein